LTGPTPSAPTSAPSTGLHRLRPLEELGLHELETLRLILRGGSVVDWRRLHLETRDQVDHFLTLHLIDFQQPGDRALAYRILKEAVDYLRSVYHYRIADAVAEPYEIQDLLLFASGRHPRYPGRYQKIACIVLKVMHVIHHMEGRELLFRTPIASSVLARRVDERVMACADQMARHGFPVVEFNGSVKTEHSVITKLLAKRDTVAAQVFDKVRYRIVTREMGDVLPVLEYLTRALFPFNLVVPSQTDNSLIDFEGAVMGCPALHPLAEKLHLPLTHEARERRRAHANPFSGDGFRVLNFVVDLPLRIDTHLPPEDMRPGRPRIVFTWVEFQIVDIATAAENEQGEKSHERYKQRQRLKVLRRLSRGLVVPKGRPPGEESGGEGPRFE
jgi:uncharacterized protein (TIGR04552 family)